MQQTYIAQSKSDSLMVEATGVCVQAHLPFASEQVWHPWEDEDIVTSNEGEWGREAIIPDVVNYGTGPCRMTDSGSVPCWQKPRKQTRHKQILLH